MFRVDDPVKYGNVTGTIKEIVGENQAIVTLEDGLDYPLNFDVLTLVQEETSQPEETIDPVLNQSVIRTYTINGLKDPSALGDIAASLQAAGYGEFIARGGNVVSAERTQTMEERIVAAREEAANEAERQVRESYA